MGDCRCKNEVTIPFVDTWGNAPEQATPGDAGYDLKAGMFYHLMAGERALVPTGLRVAIPRGYVGLVCSRSGMALKKGLFVLNAPGVVDSGYRGDVGVIIQNIGTVSQIINVGDKVAQLLIVPVAEVSWQQVPVLDDTERGEGGFGHSGN